ncbi:MAG TPA: hydrogenase maturation nickel metallochaperone HypA [Thermodesulfobacteriota bacterium]|nr:hydrogenase maturation nickel metallochaperone HypA [Thermodesulfobacteriota bacterium]
MHEAGVTESILKIALQTAEKAGAKRIGRIHIVIGDLSGFVGESIKFYFEFLSKDTAAEGAELVFRKVPARFLCQSCGREFESNDGSWICPHCGAAGAEIVSGREFSMESIEVD